MGSPTLETSGQTTRRRRDFLALGDAVGIEEGARSALGSPHHHLAGLAVVVICVAPVHGVLSTLLMKHERGYAD